MSDLEGRPNPRHLSIAPSRRIGIHLGIAGGIPRAVEHAHEIGANALQIFSSSPRMWRPSKPDPGGYALTRELCTRYDCRPLVIHAGYLINLSSQSEAVRTQSIVALRGEVERALGLGADFLVLHAGTFKGFSRERALELATNAMKAAVAHVSWSASPLEILIENTAGAASSLGGSLEDVAVLADQLRHLAPIGICLDTCHLHAAGYGIVSARDYQSTVRAIAETVGIESVRVWHMNDAKAVRGSHLDRHEHIGRGTIGTAPFRRLLRDARFAHSAFIAETPIDKPGDDERNLTALRSLAS